jgi:hypothetical protein
MHAIIDQTQLFPSEFPSVPTPLIQSLEWLSDLYERVEKEGVCRQDVQALQEVVAKVTTDPDPNDVPEVFDVPWEQPALEHYPVQSFSTEPSTLNQQVALEGITQALFQTLQRILRAMMNAIASGADLLKKAIRSETISGFKLANLHKAVLKASEGADQVEKKYIRDTSGIEEKLLAYRNDLLAGSSLRRTPYQLAALGDAEYLPQVETTIQRIHQSVPMLERYLTEVRRVLGQKGDNPTDKLADHPVFQELKTLRWQVEDLSVRSKDKQYITARKRLAYFPASPKARTRFPDKAAKLVQYKKQLSAYEQLDRQLRQIWKLNLVGDDKNLQPVLEGLRKASRTVENLQSVTEFLHQYNRTKRSALKVAYRFENKRFSLLYAAAKETVVTEPQRESLHQLKDQYTQVLATLLS